MHLRNVVCIVLLIDTADTPTLPTRKTSCTNWPTT
nr:MAG TPA: hypothetical protein [Bacteriophage sp.]